MTGLDALVLRGWLSVVAPRLTSHPGAPLAQLAVSAAARLVPNYGKRERLASALANALRRAASTGLMNTHRPGLNSKAAAGAAHSAEKVFRDFIDREIPDLEGGLASLINALPGLRGLGAVAAPEILSAFDHQIPEVLPQEGPYGLKPAVALLEDQLHKLPSELARLARRDLGSALSLLGEHSRAKACFEECGDHTRAALEAVDEALVAGDPAGALRQAEEAERMAVEAREPTYQGVALRKQAMVIGGGGEIPRAEGLLKQAVLVFRGAGDGRGEAEALEALSHSAADRGEVDRAVTLLGAVRRLQRGRAFAPGEGRALRLAGRLLCENGRPVEGMVMLFQARDLAEASDPHIEHPLEHYISGFQETLSPREMSRVEEALERDWEPQIDAAFDAAAQRAPGALDGL